MVAVIVVLQIDILPTRRRVALSTRRVLVQVQYSTSTRSGTTVQPVKLNPRGPPPLLPRISFTLGYDTCMMS